MRIAPALGCLFSAIASLHAPGAFADTLTELTASDAHSYSYFGHDVDLSGDWAIVGAHEHANQVQETGEAYVFQRTSSGWVERTKLISSSVANGSLYGFSVAIDGDRAVVGAPSHFQVPGTGRVFIFKRTGGNWAQESEITAPGLQIGDGFGTAVHIDGDRVAVGAPWGPGWVYLYERVGTQWNFDGKISHADGLDFAAQFGQALCLDGDRLAVGAPGLDYWSYDAGGAYIYERIANTWTQTAFLSASDSATATSIGVDVDLKGDTLVVGSMNDGAYVFNLNTGIWSETTKLTSASTAYDFGGAVALDGNIVLVGGSDANQGQGEVIPYTLSGGQWTEQLPVVTGAAAELGRSVAIDAGTGLIGSPANASVGGYTGAAHVVQVGPSGSFTDLGSSLAGTGPAPQLTGNGALQAGCPVTFALFSAAPSASCWLVYGIGALNAPFYGGTLIPNPSAPGGVIALATNGLGALNLTTNWPAGLPSGTQIYLQYWVTDSGAPFGLAASNGLLATTP